MKRPVRFVIVGLLLLASVRVAAEQQSPGNGPTSSTSTEQPWCPPGVNPSTPVPKELTSHGQVERVPSKPGDICVVCDKPLQPRDMVYEVNGQPVRVHVGACDAELRAHPRKWLARLKPWGSAFLGAEFEQAGLTNAWLYAGLYVLLGLIFGAIGAHCSLHAGHNTVAGFGLGFFFNIFGCLFLLTRPKREVLAPAGVPSGLRKIAATYAPEPCPNCGTTNHPAATQCLACGAPLTPRVTSEVEKAGLRRRA